MNPLSLLESPLLKSIYLDILPSFTASPSPDQLGSLVPRHPFIFIFSLPTPLLPVRKASDWKKDKPFLSIPLRMASLLLPRKELGIESLLSGLRKPFHLLGSDI